MRTPDVSRGEFFSLVVRRREPLRRYLEWALETELRAKDPDRAETSMRMEHRPDIRDAEVVAQRFAEQWWGVVVFTCFGSRLGAEIAASQFSEPPTGIRPAAALDALSFPRGSVGHHRIQSTLTGAKQALLSACENQTFFEDLLHSDADFDTRYRRLRGARLRQWGRTTSFDLLLRAGVLGVGGQRCLPEFAYLAGSTGPRKGFSAVFGVSPDKKLAPWAEAVLIAWAEHWHDVAADVGVEWEGEPLYPRDQENFLCIYQEQPTTETRC